MRKLLVYRREAYREAPVTETGGVLYAGLPEELFSVSKRSLNDELSRINRRQWVDRARQTDRGIEIDAHIYLPRYNMKEPGDQEVRVVLVNEETGHCIELGTKPKETKYLTEKKGEVADPVTNKVTKYNYDHTGFTFLVDPELFSGQNENGTFKYSVIAGYKDRIFSGNQQLRGINQTNLKKCSKMKVRRNGVRIGLNFGYMNELQIIVNK